MTKFYLWLAALKDSPAVWALVAPTLFGLAILFGPHAWIPFAAYYAALAIRNSDAQRIHFFISYLITLLGRHYGVLWLGLAWLVPAFAIEYYFDPKYEGDAWKWGGATDFASYCSGTAVGLL